MDVGGNSWKPKKFKRHWVSFHRLSGGSEHTGMFLYIHNVGFKCCRSQTRLSEQQREVCRVWNIKRAGTGLGEGFIPSQLEK